MSKDYGYPGKVAIRHVVEAARASGIDVVGVEISPDGRIRVFDARVDPQKPPNLYDELERKGRL